MNKLWKNKKVCIALLVICVLVLAGVIIGIAMKGDKDDVETGKTDLGQEIIVHESDENTVEEKAEDGLTESDSEDGPVLDENNMIDFNGSDVKAEESETDIAFDNSDGNAGKDHTTDDSTDEYPKEEDGESKDTGSWGALY